MSEEQYKKVVDALVGFVARVSIEESSNEKETEILPEIAALLLQLNSKQCGF